MRLPKSLIASSPDCSTCASTAGTRKVRLAPFMIAPASEAPSGSRVITLGMPSWMPNRTYDEPPTWNSGIETMLLSPSSNAMPSWAFRVWATMLAWVSAMPLGRPVVPEEYITRHTSSGSTSGSRPTGSDSASSASYSSPAPPSGVTSMIFSTLLSLSRILSMRGISSDPTSSTFAPESLTA